MNSIPAQPLTRRRCIRTSSALLALPWLESFSTAPRTRCDAAWSPSVPHSDSTARRSSRSRPGAAIAPVHTSRHLGICATNLRCFLGSRTRRWAAITLRTPVSSPARRTHEGSISETASPLIRSRPGMWETPPGFHFFLFGPLPEAENCPTRILVCPSHRCTAPRMCSPDCSSPENRARSQWKWKD